VYDQDVLVDVKFCLIACVVGAEASAAHRRAAAAGPLALLQAGRARVRSIGDDVLKRHAKVHWHPGAGSQALYTQDVMKKNHTTLAIIVKVNWSALQCASSSSLPRCSLLETTVTKAGIGSNMYSTPDGAR